MKHSSRVSLAAIMLETVLFFSPIRAQDSTISDLAALLRKLATTLVPASSLRSVHLEGTVTRYIGTSTTSGTARMTADADGSSHIVFSLPGGEWTESRSAVHSGRVCQVSGPDGVLRDNQSSDCWSSLVWFLPQVNLQPASISPGLHIHLTDPDCGSAGTPCILQSYLSRAFRTKDPTADDRLQRQSMTSLEVDSHTFYPRALQYTVLTDNGSTSIDAEVRYSNYHEMGGLMVPGHIERYLNGALETAIDVITAEGTK